MKEIHSLRLLAALPLLMILAVCCGRSGSSEKDTAGGNPAEESTQERQAAYDEYLKDPGVPEFKNLTPGSGRIRINNIGRLADVFNDSNKYQYVHAERLGITPITSLADAYHTSKPLVEVTTGPYYVIDSLTHSVPFLVPEAAVLLRTIGRNFIDSLGRRGATGYRIIVTSLLRTPQSVKSLRRVNRNATDSSTHKFATTFDITYTRFAASSPNREVCEEDLKNLLAEVLYDLRKQNRCMVKFERKSPCFHITVTR